MDLAWELPAIAPRKRRIEIAVELDICLFNFLSLSYCVHSCNIF